MAEPEQLPPLIVDADALNILARQSEWWTLLPPNSILTPHPGEMSRLTGLGIKEINEDPLRVAKDFAKKQGTDNSQFYSSEMNLRSRVPSARGTICQNLSEPDFCVTRR